MACEGSQSSLEYHGRGQDISAVLMEGAGHHHWRAGYFCSGDRAEVGQAMVCGGWQGCLCGGPPQQSQCLMWPLGNINCPSLLKTIPSSLYNTTEDHSKVFYHRSGTEGCYVGVSARQLVYPLKSIAYISWSWSRHMFVCYLIYLSMLYRTLSIELLVTFDHGELYCIFYQNFTFFPEHAKNLWITFLCSIGSLKRRKPLILKWMPSAH